jgi:hypothetical protein
MHGGEFLDGFWKGAVVGAVGGALSNFGGGNLSKKCLVGCWRRFYYRRAQCCA